MPDRGENQKSDDPLDEKALRARLLELKARVASLRQRVATLEQKKRRDSTPGRS
jgi:cell division protein FtsB